MGDKVKVTIDGKELEVEKGKTILEAARENGIYIPTLCYHENLKPNVSCRLCIVEIEGYDKPVTSCNTPVEDGMVIHTNTEKVNQLRKEYLRLILSYHPLDCPICDRGGSCELQDLVFRYGVETSPYKVEPKKRPSGGSVPLIEGWIVYWPDRCVLCKRCVSACSEVTCNSALEVKGAGFETFIGFANEEFCRRCGECMVYCPVGALTDVVRETKVRPWETKKVVTTCPYCGAGCQLELQVFDNAIVGVGSRFDLPPNYGNLCIKGRFGLDFVGSEERLKKPLIRRDGKLQEASWDEALSFVAERLSEILRKKGPDAIGFVASSKCTNEDNYVFQKFVRCVLKSNNIDQCERLCTVPVLSDVFGYSAMTNSVSCIDEADVVMVVGSNTAENHPVIANRIKRAIRRGKASLIVVDPRKTDLVRYASIHLSPRPGTDAFLIYGMINVILSEELYNKDFVSERTEGLSELKESVASFTPEYVESITGVSKELIEKAARFYAKAGNAAIFYSSGITQYVGGSAAVYGLCDLALLTGNVGKEGAGVNPLMGQCNVQGACDMGALPDFLPGYLRVDDPSAREKFKGLWGVDVPPDPGFSLTEMLRSDSISALYIVGENPVSSEPDIGAVKSFLSNLDFLVVQDIFLTETAELAHVVLPSKSFAEKEGTFTNTERLIQRVRAAVSPPGEAKDDWWIVCEVAKRMGFPMEYKSASEIMDEIRRVNSLYGGISHARLDSGSLRWPCPTDDHPGECVLYRDGFKDGRIKLSFVLPGEPPKEDPEYPFALITGRVLYQFHTATMTGRSKVKELFYPEALLEISPEDAESLGIKDGDAVRVVSKKGEVKVKVSVTDRVMKGMVFLPFHFIEGSCNWLIEGVVDPETGVPQLKFCSVKVERA